MSIHLEKITPLFDSGVDRHVEGQDWHANRALMDVRSLRRRVEKKLVYLGNIIWLRGKSGGSI